MNVKLLRIDDITPELIQKVSVHLPMRYARAKRFKHNRDMLRCVGVGVLLLEAFPSLNESDIHVNEQGKLFLEQECEFNVSHSGSYVALATDNTPVGIDVEQIRERHFRVAQKVFTPEEQRWMNEDVMNRFFVLWTQKESLVKAVGCGITIPLETISVMPFQLEKPVEYDGVQWFCKTVSYDGHMISVCATHPIQSINV